MKDLKGKVAVITGSTRGIGRVLAIEMAKLGATIVVHGRRLEKKSGEFGSERNTIADIEAIGGKAFAVEANLAKPDGADKIIKAVKDEFGGCDILVNNAAYMSKAFNANLYEIDQKNWEMGLNVNLNTPLWLSHAFAPTMKARGGGIIVNVTSGQGDFNLGPGVVKGFVYGTTKAALNLMSQRWARDLKQDNIAVVILEPGFTATEAVVAFATQQVADDAKDNFTPDHAHSMMVPVRTITHICTSDDPFQYVGPIIVAKNFIEENNLNVTED